MARERRKLEDDDEEPLPKPVVTYALLIVMWILFFAMAKASGWHFSVFPDVVADLFGDKLNTRIMVNHHLVQWWRFLTPVFLHGGLVHICVNAYSLYIIGRQLEPFYGSRRYFIIFMAAGFTGNLASYFFSQTPSLGASGALFGLIGAGIVFPLRFKSLVDPAHGRRIVIQLVKVAVLNLAIGFGFHNYVDNSAHIGGLLGGGFAALFLLPDALDARAPKKIRELALWLTCGAIGVVLAISTINQLRWAIGPWWRITVPATFHAVKPVEQFEGRWASADGSNIEISDTVHSPALLPGALSTLERRDIPAVWRNYDGALARVLLLHNNQDTIELHVVLAYKHILVIAMHSSTANYAKEQPEFARVIKSLRFLHTPPPDLHPISTPVKNGTGRK